MVLITRKEADMLRENGQGYDVHMSSKSHKSRAKRYYATESATTLRLLEEYKEKTIQCTR